MTTTAWRFLFPSFFLASTLKRSFCGGLDGGFRNARTRILGTRHLALAYFYSSKKKDSKIADSASNTMIDSFDSLSSLFSRSKKRKFIQICKECQLIERKSIARMVWIIIALAFFNIVLTTNRYNPNVHFSMIVTPKKTSNCKCSSYRRFSLL